MSVKNGEIFLLRFLYYRNPITKNLLKKFTCVNTSKIAFNFLDLIIRNTTYDRLKYLCILLSNAAR